MEKSADLQDSYMAIVKQAKEAIADGRIAAVAIIGCGAYTVGMDGHDLPDVVIVSNVDNDSEEYAQFLANASVNFYHHISLMVDAGEDQRIVEHDDYAADNDKAARFLLRKVPMEKPWEHLVVQRDLAPNDSLIQIHLPDSNNRVWGEEGYQPHHTRGEVLFEVVPNYFN